jgi:Toprim-like
MNKLTPSKIKQIISEQGLNFKEKPRTIYTVCPDCNRSDKLSILKANGFTICYRGSCEFKGPRPFYQWLMKTAKITADAAMDKIYNDYDQEYSEEVQLKLNLKNDLPEHLESEQNIYPVEWPLAFTETLDSPSSKLGVLYLESRGISKDIGKKYKIWFNYINQRIIFPIYRENTCIGWQARSINSNVIPKMLNSTGFQRASSVMFIDNVKEDDFVIITEGPIDAIKFDLCGNTVATMGKIISEKQIKIIMEKNPKKIYLALDDDAAPEMRKLQSKIQVPVYKIDVPESAKQRCLLQNKKADFGECTFEECLEAFKNSRQLSHLNTVLYLKD